MKILEAYSELDQKFHLPKASIYEALCFFTKQDYDWVVSHQNDELVAISQYQSFILNLKQNIPVAYLLNQKSFFGLSFFVDQRVLIPRVETEVLIEQAKVFLKKNLDAQILDLGTGSGILGLTLKKLFPKTEVYLTDISVDALQVAQINAEHHQLKVNFLIGDFLTPILEKGLQFDLIVCNPPYVDQLDSDLEISTQFEPKIALFAQEKGLIFYRQIFEKLPLLIKNLNNFCLVMEFGWKQKLALEKMAADCLDSQLYRVEFQKDYSNLWRCIIISSNCNLMEMRSCEKNPRF